MSQFSGGGGVQPTPWYKENPFWGGIGGFFSFLFAGVGFGVNGYLTLERWLLAGAFPWGVLAIWLALNGLISKKSIRISSKVTAILALGSILALSAVRMGKVNTSATVQPNSGPQTKSEPESRPAQRPSPPPKQAAPIEGKTHRPVSNEKSTPPVSGGFTNWLATLNNPPTMSDVFFNDFPATMRLHDEGEFHWNGINTVTYIKRQLYLDFPGYSKFVGFYIPTTDPSDLSRTAEICMKLAQMDAVQQALTELPKKTFIAAGLGQTTTIGDLTFSGRVVIYHDDFLSITQQADIIRAFSEKHYAVGFFGPSDFGKTLSSWHHLHDAKVVPQ